MNFANTGPRRPGSYDGRAMAARETQPAETEAGLSRLEGLKARIDAALQAKKYVLNCREYDQFGQAMVAQAGFGSPEQQAKWRRLKQQTKTAAIEAAAAADVLTRHRKPKMAAAGRNLGEIIRETAPLGTFPIPKAEGQIPAGDRPDELPETDRQLQTLGRN